MKAPPLPPEPTTLGIRGYLCPIFPSAYYLLLY